jgi:hypothetical protein
MAPASSPPPAPAATPLSFAMKGVGAANAGITGTAEVTPGNATSTTTLNKDYAIAPAGWYANLEQGPDLQGDNARPLACGDLKAA